MKEVKLRMNEQLKYEEIKKCADGYQSKERTSIKLGITIRQVNKLINIYKQKGKEGFIHGNRNRKPANYKGLSLRNKIITLYQNKYKLVVKNSNGDDVEWSFNINHFRELLKKNENIDVSYTYLYNLFKSQEILSPKAHKKTKRELAKKKILEEKANLNKTESEIEELVDHRLALELSHPRKERCKYFGEKIEMDASEFLWFAGIKTHLHLAIDNCTGKIVGGWFDYQETLNGYYNVFYQILTNYGIPYSFLTDNRTVFYYESIKRKTPEKDVLTQFGYACKTLGTDLLTTSVPQAKGMIERLNGTVQGRLPGELMLNNISTIEEANNYLINIFIPELNERFSLSTSSIKSVFEDSPKEEFINTTLAILTPRKFDNGSSIKFKNEYYQAYDETNKLTCFLNHTEGLVIEAFNKELYVTVDDHIYELRKKEKHKKISTNFDVKEETPKEKKKYIPPMSHPWKSASFKRQMEKAHAKHAYA